MKGQIVMWIRKIEPVRGFWHFLVNDSETLCGYLEAKDRSLDVEAVLDKPAYDLCGFCTTALKSGHPVFGKPSHNDTPGGSPNGIPNRAEARSDLVGTHEGHTDTRVRTYQGHTRNFG